MKCSQSEAQRSRNEWARKFIILRNCVRPSKIEWVLLVWLWVYEALSLWCSTCFLTSAKTVGLHQRARNRAHQSSNQFNSILYENENNRIESNPSSRFTQHAAIFSIHFLTSSPTCILLMFVTHAAQLLSDITHSSSHQGESDVEQ